MASISSFLTSGSAFAGNANVIKASHPAGAMFGPMMLVNGRGVQVQSFHRWGDYSSMSVDPSDDCTLWYTQEYYANTGSVNWSTRIGSFKFNSCRRGNK